MVHATLRMIRYVSVLRRGYGVVAGRRRRRGDRDGQTAGARAKRNSLAVRSESSSPTESSPAGRPAFARSGRGT